VRVLELGQGVSAPYATKLLADLGADVIKVEPSEGDWTRRRGPFTNGSDPNASGLFLALNTNKQSIVAGPHELQRLPPLLETADIIITNYSPAELAALGVELEQLKADRPELVVCSVSAFGLEGPNAQFRAEELTVSHAGGWAYQCPGASTDADQPPLKVFGHQCDFHAGMAVATIALATLTRAGRTGLGDHIDFSSVAHTAGMLEAALIAASYMGENPNRLGSRLLNPWGIFECSDGLIFLVTVEQDQWERLVELMGTPEWVRTGLYDTTELRLENEDLLVLYLEEWTREHTVDELWKAGQEHRICFAPVLTMADMAEQDHLRQRDFLVDIEHPVAGTLTHLGRPFRSSIPLATQALAAPLLDDAAEPGFGPGAPGPGSGDHQPNPSGTGQRGPLDGVRVLDLTWVWAGPYATLHLAHLGAEVIKVESALRPGLGRRLPLHPTGIKPSLNTSAYFNQWEQGKLSCQLDLSNPEAIALVEQLVAHCDVVIENFATGVMDKLGLGHDRLRRINPGIVMASISGYGQVGPLRQFMGYGPTTGPLSGLSSLTGYQGGPPRELGLSIGDPAAGITAAFAICAALTNQRRTGEGCHIDVALWEATSSSAVEGWMSHAMTGAQPPRMGNQDPIMAPHNCYRTDVATGGGTDAGNDDEAGDAGQWMTIACATDQEWQALATLMDPSLLDDKRFTSAQDRKRNEDALDAIIADWLAPRDRWKVTARLQEVGVAAFPTMSPQDLLDDQHLWSRGFFEQLDHPEVGRQTHAGVPWRSAVGPNGVARPAPVLGQHTHEVLGRLLNLTTDEIDDLHQRGVCQ